MFQYSASVQAHIPVTVLVVQVVLFVIQPLTVTAQVCQFTEVTGNAILVSVIVVTCQSVFVVIVCTFVEVHLVVYAVCVVKADCGVYHNAVVTSELLIPVMYHAQLVKSDVSVGTVILAVTLELALAVNVLTVVPFF